MDFSYDSYRSLLYLFQSSRYKNILFGESINARTLLYLRHDVDVNYLGVLPLARIEHEFGYRSTWYFLPNYPAYNILSPDLAKIMQELVSMGHQVGVHIDASNYASFDEMLEDMNNIFTFFSKRIPIKKQVSFHKPADWLLDNDIHIPDWVNAYESPYYSEIVYVSDSNRREFWKEDRLHDALSQNKSITMLTHPIWWHDTAIPEDKVFEITCKEIGSNVVAKKLISTIKCFQNYERK